MRPGGHSSARHREKQQEEGELGEEGEVWGLDRQELKTEAAPAQEACAGLLTLPDGQRAARLMGQERVHAGSQEPGWPGPTPAARRSLTWRGDTAAAAEAPGPLTRPGALRLPEAPCAPL